MFSVWEQVHWYRLNEAEWSCFDSLGSWPAQADQQKAILEKEEKYLVGNAPINVKPERGGGRGRATHGNLTVMHIPRVGILT